MPHEHPHCENMAANADADAFVAVPSAQEVCDRHDPAFFPKFKQWADDYFLIPHRGERRGLGGADTGHGNLRQLYVGLIRPLAIAMPLRPEYGCWVSCPYPGVSRESVLLTRVWRSTRGHMPSANEGLAYRHQMCSTGIFFDDLNDRPADEILAFSTDAVNSVVPSYLPLVSKHKDDAYTEEQKQWQQMRRGRCAPRCSQSWHCMRGWICGVCAGPIVARG